MSPREMSYIGCPDCATEMFIEAPGPDETLCCPVDECNARWRICERCEELKPETEVRRRVCRECGSE